MGIAPDRGVDAPARLHDAPDERDVLLFDLPIVELPCELLVGAIVLGDDHDARCSPIEPVHDARPELAADAAQILHVVKQRIHQRAGRVTRCRMNDHPGRFVDDDEVGILIQDVEGKGFGDRPRRIGRRNVDRDDVAGSYMRVGLAGLARDEHPALLDQPLDLRARLVGKEASEEAIEPDVRRILSGRELEMRH